MLGGDDGTFSTAQTLSRGLKATYRLVPREAGLLGATEPPKLPFLSWDFAWQPGGDRSFRVEPHHELGGECVTSPGILPAEPKRGSGREKRASEEPKEAWGLWGRRADPLPKFSALKGGLPPSPKLREGGAQIERGVSQEEGLRLRQGTPSPPEGRRGAPLGGGS